ncbi:MAG: hypothetical protein AUG51_18735 [Acidobacteria bacterium 13_1_20CM_3_53_8]|nr:MAG: hypothetical protein AUG51_18735 [Acidobacteria bacterium 13_1_20CM_3_53_8]
MTLAKELLHRIANPTLTYNERARLRCQLSKQLEEAGNYEGAREAMGELWQRVGERPMLDNLDRATTAEVLLRVGGLTGWIGSAKQLEGAQETAKNLISESAIIFETLEESEKVAEARIDLATCYWREGAFDEARVILQEALNQLGNKNDELKARALLNRAIIERSAKRFTDALRFYTEASHLLENSSNHALKGKFHNSFANLLENLGRAERRNDYIDRAFVEYTAASFHFEYAGYTRCYACVENNLGFLFLTVGKFIDAHEHLDHAQVLLTSLKDKVHLAQVDDTRAKVFLAEGHVAESEKLARVAVKTLEEGGEQALLAEALTTQGVGLARLGQYERGKAALQRAVEVAQRAGDSEGAAQAALTIIEELGEHLSNDELSAAYERATELLSGSQNLDLLARLCAAARRVLSLVNSLTVPASWEGFSFKEAVRRYEARLIERALKDAGGVVSRAAQFLGFRHHQSLITLLNRRHKNLLHARTTIVPRKRSIITSRAAEHTLSDRSDKEPRTVVILYVEDNELVRKAVVEILAFEGWVIETCEDGNEALKRIESNVHFDLLLLDNELPGIRGMELVHRARAMPHRHDTPIILLTASDSEDYALRAGADACLRKPEDILALASTVARLIARKSGHR